MENGVLIEWPAQWLRGPLALCVSQIIASDGPLHGYGITQQLEESGLGKIGGGTLYPLLGRLERDGAVTTDWVAGSSGPAKKVYTITKQGAQNLAREKAKWHAFTQATHAVLTISVITSSALTDEAPTGLPQPTAQQEDSK